MTTDPLASLPLDYGMREAAVFLGVNHAALSRGARKPGNEYAPDRARMAAGKLYPSWSRARLEEIKRARESKP